MNCREKEEKGKEEKWIDCRTKKQRKYFSEAELSPRNREKGVDNVFCDGCEEVYKIRSRTNAIGPSGGTEASPTEGGKPPSPKKNTSHSLIRSYRSVCEKLLMSNHNEWWAV